MVEKITVPARPGLDDVYVYFDDIGPGAGRVILVCWDMAYTGYWGAMGDRTVREFFDGCGEDYLMGNLLGRHYKAGVVDRSYLQRIVSAVKNHLKEMKEAA